jgi:hypothetical protein
LIRVKNTACQGDQVQWFQNSHARFREGVRLDRHLHILLARLWNTFAGAISHAVPDVHGEARIIRPNAGLH